MSLCRDPVIFLLSEPVKLIEESPAKKSKEYLQTGGSLGQKYPCEKTLQERAFILLSMLFVVFIVSDPII